MDKKIVWSSTAANKFLSITDYLRREWSTNVAIDFINRVEEKLNLLKSFPKIGIKSNKKPGLYKLIISSQNMLAYRIKGSRIIVLNIFDTRQDPVKIDA